MATSGNANNVIKEILSRFHPDAAVDTQKCNQQGNGMDPSQALIITALLAGVLEVTSVLINRDQTVEIVLTGSYKQKSELDILLDKIGSKPFDEVIKAMLERL